MYIESSGFGFEHKIAKRVWASLNYIALSTFRLSQPKLAHSLQILLHAPVSFSPTIGATLKPLQLGVFAAVFLLTMDRKMFDFYLN